MAPNNFPKPEGYLGHGTDYDWLTIGTSGRLGMNVEVDEGEYDPHDSRTNPQHDLDGVE